MVDVTVFNPNTLYAPQAPYLQIAIADSNRWAFIAGQVARDGNENIVGVDDFHLQCEQVFANIGAALTALDAAWSQVVQFTSYLIRREDMSAFRIYREQHFPELFPTRAYPPSTLVLVSGLAEERYLLEVQTTVAL